MAAKHATPLSLLRVVCERFDEDRCVQIASSLTFTTLLAIVPVVTIALTVVSAFPVFSALLGQVQHFVVVNLVPSSVNAITGYAERFSRNAAGLTAVGILFLGVTALMLMFTIEGAFNDIWRVTFQRRILRRVVIYAMMLVAGPVLIGASRKRFLGELTKEDRPDQRTAGTIAACLECYRRGATIFRVHDVAPVRQALAVAHAIALAR